MMLIGMFLGVMIVWVVMLVYSMKIVFSKVEMGMSF